MKKCIICDKEKDLIDFYKHKGMLDGRLNVCKTCCKERSKKREKELRSDESWVEKEKQRAKEKYKRLNYKEKQKEWDKDKPWKSKSIYKNLNRNLKAKGILKDGQVAHHWSYNDADLKDVFILSSEDHRKLHTFLDFDLELKYFIYKDVILDSKEIHEKIMNELLNN